MRKSYLVGVLLVALSAVGVGAAGVYWRGSSNNEGTATNIRIAIEAFKELKEDSEYYEQRVDELVEAYTELQEHASQQSKEIERLVEIIKEMENDDVAYKESIELYDLSKELLKVSGN